MVAGKKSKKIVFQEYHPEDRWINSRVTARNLRKADLGAVIFGCTHHTIKECQLKQLFGLPLRHFSYVRNITPGLTLFLFNYNDRKLHGIFEAVGTGQLNINPYAWTDEGTEKTPYPAQVQVRVREQCRSLREKEYAAIIADNYYEEILFWFELDRTQTRKLMDLFSSSAPGPHINGPFSAPRSQNTVTWSSLFNDLPSSDVREVDNGVRASIPEETAHNPYEVGTECDSWESSDPKPEGERSYASVLSSKSTTLEQKSWISMFKPSAASSGLHKKESLQTQASKQAMPPSDDNNIEWECHLEACSNDWDSEGSEEPLNLKPSSTVSDVLPKVTDSCALNSSGLLHDSDDWDSEGCEETLDMEPSSTDSNELSKVTGAVNPSTSNVVIPTIGLRERTGHVQSTASGLLHGADEPNPVWESCVPHVFTGNGTSLKTSMATDAKGSQNSVDPVKSFDVHFALAQLMREVEELKGSHLRQNRKVNSLEQELVQSRIEILHLRKQCNMLASRSTSFSCGQFEEVETEASIPFPVFDNSVLILGGYNGSSWVSDLSLYSPTNDVVRSLTPMTFLRSYASAAKLNGELYLCGGVRGDEWYDTVESYNPKHNQWITRPSLNRKRGSLAGVSVLEKLFAIGGGNGVECYSEVEMFDANIGKWIFTQPMRQKRFAPAVAEINGAVYVVGGYDGAQYLKSIERFDPRESKWTALSSMSTKRGCHSAVVLNEKLYAFGGYDGKEMVSTVEVFDPRACSWRMIEPMKHARGYFGAVMIGGKIYAIGGLKEKEEILDSIELYEEGYGWQVMSQQALGRRCFISAVVL